MDAKNNIRIRVAVLSDLHFISEEALAGKKHPSWLVIDEKNELSSGLWSDLEDLIENEELQTDLVLCPGDITTWANKKGLVTAWDKLNNLAGLLDSDLLATATGNHDIESRAKNIGNEALQELDVVTGLTENLKLLNPPYPIQNSKSPCGISGHNQRLHYFGSHFVIHNEHPDYRVVVFNSCCQHTSEPSERERGVIPQSTLNWLDSYLETNCAENKINIFLCHHHPVTHLNRDGTGQYDAIHNAPKLISTLDKHGDWLIIHGHKHNAQISYASSGGSTPITVFSAGSLSNQLPLGEKDQNQFYILDLEYDRHRVKAGQPQAIRGTIQAWNWFDRAGWIPSTSIHDGIYTGTGFGERNLDNLADEVEDELGQIGVPWEVIASKIPKLKQITPSDLIKLNQKLNTQFEINIEIMSGGKIGPVVRK